MVNGLGANVRSDRAVARGRDAVETAPGGAQVSPGGDVRRGRGAVTVSRGPVKLTVHGGRHVVVVVGGITCRSERELVKEEPFVRPIYKSLFAWVHPHARRAGTAKLGRVVVGRQGRHGGRRGRVRPRVVGV